MYLGRNISGSSRNPGCKPTYINYCYDNALYCFIREHGIDHLTILSIANSKCSNIRCENPAEHGAHITLDNGTDVILPLCPRCNYPDVRGRMDFILDNFVVKMEDIKKSNTENLPSPADYRTWLFNKFSKRELDLICVSLNISNWGTKSKMIKRIFKAILDNFKPELEFLPKGIACYPNLAIYYLR